MKKFLLILLFAFVLSQARRDMIPSPTSTDETETETEKKNILQKLGDFVHNLIQTPKDIYDTLLGQGAWEQLVSNVVNLGKEGGTYVCSQLETIKNDCENFIGDLANTVIGILS